MEKGIGLAAKFEEKGSQETAKELLRSLVCARKEKRMKAGESINFVIHHLYRGNP